MGYGSIVSIFDRLSVRTVLSNQTGSYVGFLATLAFLAVCLIVLIPPVNQYFQGVYFESQFRSSQMPRQSYNTGDDIVVAMVFKNRKTGQLANHTEILQKLNSYGFYFSKADTYKIDLEPCRPDVFAAAINPMPVTECIMLPADLEVEISPVERKLPSILVEFTFKCDDVFKCNANSDYFKESTKYIVELNQNFYFQYIFNSKVLDDKGRYVNQFHKIYSTEYNSPDGIASYVGLQMSQKKYFVDDSILPWWNNRTYQNVFWSGQAFGSDGNQLIVQAYGFYNGYQISPEYFYSFRYYKKLDFLLGMIGGAVFLIFLFFWLPCSYLNRTLQKMKNAQELLLTKDDIITTDQHLHKVQIPWHYIFSQWLPCNKTNEIIQAAQNEIDIARLIKKMKVTHRNLRVKGGNLVFKSKDVDLSANEPDEFIPDRPALENYEISLEACQALSKSPSTGAIYETNPVALALTENNNSKIDVAMQDEHYEKFRGSRYESLKQTFVQKLDFCVRYFDVFGAKPMLNADPQTSSCWGFFLTLVIILLACLTFALTIKNMDGVKIITSHIYESPNEHNYLMTTSKDFRLSFCVPSQSWNMIAGANKTTKITFFKQSKKYGFEQIQVQPMLEDEFRDYFELKADDPFAANPSQNCFKPVANQQIPMGGSFETTNQAYFGIRLDPYCNGLPAECQARKNQTIEDFLKFVNYNSYIVLLSENKYSPQEGRMISGITSNAISESQYVMNASLLRTQTFFVSAVQLLDDTDKSFLRNPPKSLVKTMAFTDFGNRNVQRKGNPDVDPAYVLQFRSDGQVKQFIKRSYKIDFLLGLIGGCFLFWYFFVHFFAKFYNAYKIRAKLAEVLHQEDGYDESMLVHCLYLIKFPSALCCCMGLKQDIERVSLVDQKMQRDLDYLNFVKTTDTCYRLSSSLFDTVAEKDLSQIYFREKIDESEVVKPKRINELKGNEFEDDEFLEMDEGNLNEEISNAGTSNIIPEMSGGINVDLQKLVHSNRSKDSSPLYDPLIPNKKQNPITSLMKRLDAFKNPPELTLDGQREVKSIFGAIMFFILATCIIIICYYFLRIFTTGSDFTVSHRRILDGNLEAIDPSSTLGELSQGINFNVGQNFKFAVAFNKKDRYFPHNVSQYIGPIGIRMLQYTITKANGQINETYEETEMQPCNDSYFNGFFSPYDDKEAFANISLAYCIPDGKIFNLMGIPEDNIKKYFKLNIYNKYKNETGRAFLNSFWRIYLTTYYMSAPRKDIFAKNFQYQMVKYNFETDLISYPLESNITLTKLIYTSKYYSRSRQTYNDQANKKQERRDTNYLSDQFTRNITFYYDGILDHYTLDYPGAGELFGLVGGVIALFIFFFYNCVSSFNEYRMKYLIGQRLYTFDKKISGLLKEKGKKPNLKKIQQAVKKINNFREAEIFLAWLLNPIGYIRDNYNFNKTLRRITLVIDKVENDINLYNVYKNINTYQDSLNKKIKLAPSEERDYDHIRLTSIFLKHIYNPDPTQNHIHIVSKQAKKHKLSSYEQVKIKNAIDAKIDPKAVLGDKTLNRAFGIDESSSVYRGNMEEERSEERSQSSPNRKKAKKSKSSKPGHEESHEQLNVRQRDPNAQNTRNVETFSIEDSSHADEEN